MRLKRSIDIAAAFFLLVVLLPVLALMAVGVFFTLGRPIFFLQIRLGHLGVPFLLIKFRTMKTSREGATSLSDGERLTPFGRLLREHSLDELPQLWNVLKGEMSLVGPRPLLPRYLSRFSPSQRRRLEVKPGITGWAQIHGRNALDWEPRFEHDVWYVDHWSLALDLRILAHTAACVFRRDGIRGRDHDTMAEFQGSADIRHCPNQKEP
jgi:lipopolysaccharide/colanic/teichoic acid biosynthesis glycosyltransferase